MDGDVASLPPLPLGTSHTKPLGSHAVAEVPAWYTVYDDTGRPEGLKTCVSTPVAPPQCLIEGAGIYTPQISEHEPVMVLLVVSPLRRRFVVMLIGGVGGRGRTVIDGGRDSRLFDDLAKTLVLTNIASNVVQLHLHSLLQGPTQVLFFAPTGTQPPPMTKADIDCRSERIEHLCAKCNEQFLPLHRPHTMHRKPCQPMSGPKQSRSRIPLLRPV